MKKVFYIALVLVISASCKTESSDDINVSAVYQAYLLTYNKTHNNTHACAQFRDGGALGNDIVLNSPSKVTLDGEVMTHQDFPYDLYYHYYKKYDGETMEVTFKFTDKNNKEYTNVANLSTLPSIDFPAGLNEISKAHDFEFIWVGEPIGEDETVQLTVSDNDLSTSFSQSTLKATSLTLTKADLAQFQLGTLTMILSRYHNGNIQQSTEKGGAIMLEYELNGSAKLVD